MNIMNNSKKRNGLIIILLVLVVAVWGIAIAGWVKSFFSGFSISKTGDYDMFETQNIDESSSFESAFQTQTQQDPAETDAVDTSAQSQAPQESDFSGVWNITFHRYYSYEVEGSWESIGAEEVYMQMEIYPGRQFECDILPSEGYINGESYEDSLASQPQLYTGEVSGNTLRLYLDLDDFYLNPDIEVSDTILPGYIDIPIVEENSELLGNYDYTWTAVVDGYNLQSRVTIELIRAIN